MAKKATTTREKKTVTVPESPVEDKVIDVVSPGRVESPTENIEIQVEEKNIPEEKKVEEEVKKENISVNNENKNECKYVLHKISESLPDNSSLWEIRDNNNCALTSRVGFNKAKNLLKKFLKRDRLSK